MNPSSMDLIATIVRTAGRERLTEREFRHRLVERMTSEQGQRHYDDSCCYYESRDGPYEHLIERAITYGVIVWDTPSDRYRIGLAGKNFGVYAARKRGR